MNKYLLLIIPTILFIILLFLLNAKTNNSEVKSASTKVENGTQSIEVLAKGGYFPNKIEAKANTPTILNIKTQNTFDCSLALVIPALKVREMLPQTGVKEYKIEPQKPGTEIIGTCSMGMYSFVINFN